MKGRGRAVVSTIRDEGPLPRRESFTSGLHRERVAAILGLALGVSFGICFLTGLISHVIQRPPGWLTWPARPAGFYRISQGLHIATGTASIPLLLAKLWSVYPHLWSRPAVRDITHLVERVALLPLVGGSLFLLFTGTVNVARWYGPMPFFFTVAHYWVAWITIGALVIHVGAKVTIVRRALSPRSPDLDEPLVPATGGLGRRGFLATVFGTSAVIVLTTAGQTLRPLTRIGLLAPRRPDVGPQGLPVNRSAIEAAVVDAARDPDWSLSVDGAVERPLRLDLAGLRAMPQRQATLPIACVEGWSASATWRGVRVSDLLVAAGARLGASVLVDSLEREGLYRRSTLNRLQAADPDTLLALELDGEPLHLDHGFPARLISPNRPGVMCTKWVTRLEVL